MQNKDGNNQVAINNKADTMQNVSTTSGKRI